jgi:hypothetical protein
MGSGERSEMRREGSLAFYFILLSILHEQELRVIIHPHDAWMYFYVSMFNPLVGNLCDEGQNTSSIQAFQERGH